MQETQLGAQISHMLKARGVEVIFGIPGVHNQELYRGIEDSGLRHVLARHEQGAGFMADGYARATGRPGVAYLISGPGLCNAMTPIGQAFSDSVPMLVIASCLDGNGRDGGRLHEMVDQVGAGASVADWSLEAGDAETAYALVDRALTEFTSLRPRPKVVNVTIPALEERAPAAPPAPEIGVEAPDLSGVPELARLLSGARRPLMIFGGGAAACHGAARRVAEKAGAATFATYAGRGVLGADYPLDFGSYLARPDSASVLARADLVVVFGSMLSETDLWRDDLGHRATMVRIDIDPAVLNDRYGAELRIQARSAQVLAALEPLLPPARTDWTASDVSEARARWRAEVDLAVPGVVPVCDALRRVLPADVTIYSDMTQFAYSAKEVWPMAAPRRWHHPTGFGTLGYALPAAIGGKIGLGAAPVLAIAGDYGFQYTAPELATAVELGLNLPILIWDNGKLGAIEDSMVRAQIAPNAVIQRNPDFLRLAEAYGARSAAPQTLAALSEALREAWAAKVPTLIRITPDIARG